MQVKNKKRIWKKIISVAVIVVILLVALLITGSTISSKAYLDDCHTKVENMIAFLTSDGDDDGYDIYYDIGNYYLDMHYICYPSAGDYLYKAEKFPFFLSSEDKKQLKAYVEFFDNYPDLSDIREAYKNNEIDILKAKELCFYEIQEALAENGLDDFSYIYRYSDKFGDFGD